VWHFVHGWPVALAMAGFADAGGVATASIPNASTDKVTVATAARTSTDLTAFEFCIVEPLHPNRLLTDIWRGAHFNGRIIPARQYQATSKICWALPQFLMAANGMAPNATRPHLIRINARSAAGC